MSLYTMTIHEVYYSYNNDYIAIANDIFSQFTYPIYDEKHRQELNVGFVKRFYNREIAFDNWDEWILALDNKFNDIAPKYNLMWIETERLLDEGTIAFFGSSRIEKYKETHEDNNTRVNQLGNTGKDVTTPNLTTTENAGTEAGTTPFTPYNMDKYVNEISNATNTRKQTGTSETRTESNSTENELENRGGNVEYEKTVDGSSVNENSYDALMKYWNEWKNVDRLFYDDCNSLFMGIC